MGCAPSLLDEDTRQDGNENNKMDDLVLESKNPEELLSSYIGLDREIGRLESSSPAPTFGRAIACLKQLNALLPLFQTTSLHQGEFVEEEEEDDKEEEEVERLLIELGVEKGGKVAGEHEEFIANVNRTVLERNRRRIVKKLQHKVQQQLEQSSTKVNYLQKLYQNQEALLMNIFGASYGSEVEKSLEQETDTMHNFRDTLAIGVLQWQDGDADVSAAASLAHRAIISWKALANQSIERKVALAADARNNMQEAALLVQRVQDTLPGVQLPYCSERELRAILQAIEYVFTDILIQERYTHALKVYENFHHRITVLQQWIVKTLNSSLRKDLIEFDAKLAKISKKLRDERIKQICLKLKIPNSAELALDQKSPTASDPTSMYQRPMKPESRYRREAQYRDVLSGRLPLPLEQDQRQHAGESAVPAVFSDPNLEREFQRKLDARRSAMWPSRRIEELRQLTITD